TIMSLLPKGILFDLDDTIIAYGVAAEPIWKSICNTYAERSGMGDPSRFFEAIDDVRKWYWSDSKRHRIGRMDLDNTRTKLIHLALDGLGIDDRLLGREISNAFACQLHKEIRFFPEAEETLVYLKSRGTALALMTNGESHKQREKIDRFHLNRFFSTILIEGELGFGKPDKNVYITALNRLGLSPKDVWSIGDNLEWDVFGPQKLGIFGIWCNSRGQDLPDSPGATPNRVVGSIAELMEPQQQAHLPCFSE
ncbi:HAD family hydrolase, partial [Thermodesulfobacteriota bacterium]